MAMAKSRNHFYKTLCLLITLFPTIATCYTDTLTHSEILTNNQTLVSSNDVFELGFFCPGNSNSNKWYIGLWYKTLPQKTYVWVANRDNPVTNPSSTILKISNQSIVLFDDTAGKEVWSSNQTDVSTTRPVLLQLLDSGNIVLKLDDSDEYLWQSFDYPTDTLLPEMRLGWDFNQNLERYISSWKNHDDPSTGDFAFKLDYHGMPEVFLWQGQEIVYRSGPWNGRRFSGVPEMKPVDNINFDFVVNKEEVYYSFEITTESLFSRLAVSSNGLLQRFTWINDTQLWSPFWYAPKDQCDNYRECGPFGNCDTNASPVCKCLKGFEPANPQAWNLRDGSGGCLRKTELDCVGDKFLHLRDVKLPESTTSYVDRDMSLKDCEEVCLGNCSCTGYAIADIRNGGSGCVTWVGELVDIRQYSAGGQDFYLRLAASDLGDDSRLVPAIIGTTVSISVLLFGLGVWFLWKMKKVKVTTIKHKLFRVKTQFRPKGTQERSQDLLLNELVIFNKKEYTAENNPDELELPLFDFDTLAIATDNFSDENKLGQGGFGCVHKGTLVDGEEIAVKRLSRNSGQGIEEFKNEVKLIARLQHRNLVRLVGCCIDMDEKMLIYEYMLNRSLDSVLFNKSMSPLLTWQKRFNIIYGIARGILYLHEDSRFRIIHRDLKASNILLDGDMNPKISDFGMARIFGTDQTEANTRRVVGTYGYMAPEYAMDGNFSVKSDAFSFGVLVLEIVSGKKNRGFYHQNTEHNLLGHAWRQWKDGKGLELVDPAIGDSYPAHEVLRCIQVGLLCVQERAEDRPTMASVVLMLSSDTATMRHPKTPGFCLGRSSNETDSTSSKQDGTFTINQVTVTMLEAR